MKKRLMTLLATSALLSNCSHVPTTTQSKYNRTSCTQHLSITTKSTIQQAFIGDNPAWLFANTMVNGNVYPTVA